MVTSAVLRAVREKILTSMPTREGIKGGGSVKVEVDVATLRAEEETRFDALIATDDWDGLLIRYPIRESSAFERVVNGITLADQTTYRSAVLKLLQDDPATLANLRSLLGDLHADITASTKH